MNKEEAVEKIKSIQKIIQHCYKWGGVLMFDKNKGDIYFCNESEETYYERWIDKEGVFELFEWRFNRLKSLDLEIVYDSNIGLVATN
jgi:hypothetical protein